ncbi:hypothetical protein TNCV_481041 [Trichonephila clavipes]|nr:hypothetical protein TNCV_481041 [Trichonephila clavipes]
MSSSQALSYGLRRHNARMAADEVVGCTRAFLTKRLVCLSELVCRERPKPGVLVNDISQTHWSQHLLTAQSEQPN